MFDLTKVKEMTDTESVAAYAARSLCNEETALLDGYLSALLFWPECPWRKQQYSIEDITPKAVRAAVDAVHALYLSLLDAGHLPILTDWEKMGRMFALSRISPNRGEVWYKPDLNAQQARLLDRATAGYAALEQRLDGSRLDIVTR